MIIYALDSNIISYLLKGNEQIAERIETEISSGHEVIIPPIAYYEVKRGLLAVNSKTKMQIFLDFCNENEVGNIDMRTLNKAADIYAELKVSGIGTEDADILIGAFCIVNNYTLVTNNIKHFSNIKDLSLISWID
ncbi:MAG: PIN domain-containing protein [Oscillospiraceae bacterium]|nr:PIN domain-containing protein [Oscillospiraceae bacterium]